MFIIVRTRVAYSARPLGPAALDVLAAGLEREALVRADEHHDGVGLLLLGLLVESLAQSTRCPSRCRCRCAGRGRVYAAVGEAAASSASSGIASESPVTSSFFSGSGRVCSPSAAGSNASGVTGGTAPRAALGGGGAEAAALAQVLVGRQPRRRLVGDLVQRDDVAHRAGGLADGEHERAHDAGLHLLARLADAGPARDEQQQRDEEDRLEDLRARRSAGPSSGR